MFVKLFDGLGALLCLIGGLSGLIRDDGFGSNTAARKSTILEERA